MLWSCKSFNNLAQILKPGCAAAATGSTANFDLPPEELEKFSKEHHLDGGSQASHSTEDDDDDYPENLVYVSSPKVGRLCMQGWHLLHGRLAFAV